jgi:hypothetical protein
MLGRAFGVLAVGWMLLIALGLGPVCAAHVGSIVNENQIFMIGIDGEIVNGDARNFEAIVKSAQTASEVWSSSCGNADNEWTEVTSK